ncbi:MAG: FAD-binding oxidoreductase [Conexibacter sp.]
MSARPLLDELAAGLPDGGLLTDPDVVAGYELDATGRFRGTALAVARPRDAAQVAQVLDACVRHRVPLVPQGGNTGLVGAGVPRDGELLLSLRALDAVGDVDLDALQVEVGAGATLEQVQAAAARAGLELPIDHAARSAATIGGMVATNAGGPLAVRYGSMRARVAGLEAAIPGVGLVSRMGGLLKDNAGYDLSELLVGSEGTLGVVTAARLSLVPRMPFRVAALFGVGGVAEGLRLLRALRAVPGLEAVDVFDAAGIELVCAHRRIARPFAREHATYVIVQCAAASDVTEELAAAVDAMEDPPDVVAATDASGREGLWTYREALNESIRAAGIPHKLDVALPIAALPAFDRALRQLVADAAPDWRLYVYGHLGDGNLHVNVLGPDPEDERVDELVLRCAAGFGGTISAEHGVGRAKRQWLSLCRSDADIAAMRAVKRALDPAGVLSPGRVLPDDGADGVPS